MTREAQIKMGQSMLTAFVLLTLALTCYKAGLFATLVILAVLLFIGAWICFSLIDTF